MKVFKGETFAEVYKDSLIDLYNNAQYETRPRDLAVKENLKVALEFSDPISSIYNNDRRSSQYKYIAAELLWYFLGRDDVEFISKYAGFWKAIQNEDGSINSSYGNLLFNKKNRYGTTQYEWALNSLLKDKDTRQAVMHFNLPEHQHFDSKDFVCTMYGIFHIRDNKLLLNINMRSNDAILGTPTDIAFFTLLQQQMLNHLKYEYPNLTLGSYTHVTDSYHIYERHFDLVKDMIDLPFIPVSFPHIGINLISENGKPSSDLRLLESHYDSNNEVVTDDVYNWIQNNIRDEVII